MNSLTIANNIIKRVFKNPKEIISLIIVPVILIIIISFGMGNVSNDKTLINIVNNDNGLYGDYIIDFLNSQEEINIIVHSSLTQEEIDKLLESRNTSTLIITKDFSNNLEVGNKVSMYFSSEENTIEIATLKQKLNQYVLTLYNVNIASTDIVSKNSLIKNDIVQEIIQELNSDILTVGTKYINVGTNESYSSKISLIGFTIMFLMILVFTTVGTIIEDKKKLTLARMYVSAVKEWEIIVGNILGSLFLGVIQLITILITIKYIFNITSFTVMSGISLVYLCLLISTIGLGIGISGIIKSNLNIMTINATIITPTCILGGCFIPSSMLPNIMNKIGYIVPQKWAMEAIINIFNGSGINSILLNLFIIIGFGLVFSTFGLKTIRPIED